MKLPRSCDPTTVKVVIIAATMAVVSCLLLCIPIMRRPRVVAINRDAERRRFVRRITQGRPNNSIDQIRMTQECFVTYCKLLRGRGGLKDTMHMSVEEQIVLFLHTLGHNVRNQVIAFRFSQSQETVSRYWNAVLKATLKLYSTIVKQPDGEHVPDEIQNDTRFFSYFKVYTCISIACILVCFKIFSWL